MAEDLSWPGLVVVVAVVVQILSWQGRAVEEEAVVAVAMAVAEVVLVAPATPLMENGEQNFSDFPQLGDRPFDQAA